VALQTPFSPVLVANEDYLGSAGAKNSRNEKCQFWQQDNHPVELSNIEMTKSKLNYLHDNPVNVGIVRKAEDYVLSSTSDYYGTEKGAIELSLIPNSAIEKISDFSPLFPSQLARRTNTRV
jgi:hypothetical protein